MYQGAITALILPFKNGEIDEESYRKLIEWQIEQGIDGLIPCGSTGESATLSHEEHDKAIHICIDQVKKRVPIIAGCGSNNTKEAIHLTEFAKVAGADAAMLISPYYNKPTQEGIFRHYKAVNDAVSIPLYAYNVPSRTGSNICPKTMVRMYQELPHMVGVKEASGNLVQVSNIIEYAQAIEKQKPINVFIGDDHTVLASLAVGAHGTISVVSNIMPKETAQMCAAWRRGDVEEAKRLHFILEPLSRAMFIETNPVPVKTALAMMGIIQSSELRLPLCELVKENEENLRKALQDAKLI